MRDWCSRRDYRFDRRPVNADAGVCMACRGAVVGSGWEEPWSPLCFGVEICIIDGMSRVVILLPGLCYGDGAMLMCGASEMMDGRAHIRRSKINRVSETGDLYEDIGLLCPITIVSVFWLPDSMELFNLFPKYSRAATRSQESDPEPYLATVVSLHQSCDLRHSWGPGRAAWTIRPSQLCRHATSWLHLLA